MQTSGAGYPAAMKLGEGRRCLVTRRGIVTVRGLRSPATEPTPLVSIEETTVDDRAVTQEQLRSLPPGRSHFSFAFVGINLASPQKVQYRYMLCGVDRSWVYAGSRRTAYYTDIPHGRHLFLISARNAGGAWSDPATLSLAIRPYVYQTTWFRLLASGLLVLAGFALYRLRVRALQSRFNAVSAERNLMAREIHDTLAQSFVAVSMRLELMAQLLRSADDIAVCREQIGETSALVRESLAEARRSIWDLRSEGAGAGELPARLARLAQEAKRQLADAQFNTTGAYRPLDRSTEDEIFRIAQESVANVLRHAEAETLSLQLTYALESLTLVVADDGRGFDPEHAPSRQNGHFGLTGMQERARLIRAEVMLDSSPGEGTRVRVRLPLRRERKTRT